MADGNTGAISSYWHVTLYLGLILRANRSPFEIESETANYTSGSKSPQSPQETPHAGQEHVDNRSKPNAGAVVTFPAWGVASLAVTLAFLW